MKAPLVLPAPASSSKEKLASQGFKAYRDLRDHLGSPGRKDSRVMFCLNSCNHFTCPPHPFFFLLIFLIISQV